MSIGDGKPIERMRLALDDTPAMENRGCLGLLYVALSRVEKDENWVLVNPVPYERINCVNTHSMMPGRRQEDERLRALSAATEARHATLKTPEAFVELLRQVDELAADGITDAACTAPPGADGGAPSECACAACEVARRAARAAS